VTVRENLESGEELRDADIVNVRAKGGAALAFSHGRYSLKLAAGETADKWLDGSPITRSEFKDVLAPHAEVEIAERSAATKSGPPTGRAAGNSAAQAKED
jgi:hypothetical protein